MVFFLLGQTGTNWLHWDAEAFLQRNFDILLHVVTFPRLFMLELRLTARQLEATHSNTCFYVPVIQGHWCHCYWWRRSQTAASATKNIQGGIRTKFNFVSFWWNSGENVTLGPKTPPASNWIFLNSLISRFDSHYFIVAYFNVINVSLNNGEEKQWSRFY